jgi:general secretion pathway protein H
MSPAGKGQSGFTLIELMVTLALAGLLLALVPPLLDKGGDRARLRHESRVMLDQLHQARSRAIAGDREVAMRFDPAARRFGIDGLSQSLAGGVALEIETPSDEVGRIRFFPDGGASGGLIRLSNGSGAARLQVDWLTGMVEQLK